MEAVRGWVWIISGIAHWYGHQVNLYVKEVCSVVDLEVVALEKFVNLVPYCQVAVLSWSSNG